ncbi:protein bark beetle isoform X2 [Tribolium madens]|uniref:protein bark beetle isoform X2 n=1 Tax=Tribolium madens TaxID=41895 RepID=UPI001CF7678C|nr:protein bark beetle isoform X2 [Tribolium madens]
MFNFLRTLFWCFGFAICVNEVVLQETEGFFGSTEGSRGGRTEHPGGTIVNDKLVFSKFKSPYWLRNDIIVERNAELIIEPGVTINVEPQVGITVRGVLTAVGTENERIVITTAEETSAKNINFPDIRLSDGPTILAGRVQVRHNGRWRSVCTNSKNWTRADMETACRQLGFQGGSFFNWFDRQMPLKPRLLYEEPKCTGTESSLFDCDWNSRQMGAGVCDYHPDLAIQCSPRHDKTLPFWRGIRFEDAKYKKVLTQSNTLYIPLSLSKLQYVQILYAGAGRNQNASSAVEVEGTPPVMDNLEIINSAYNGINITRPEGPFSVNNCTLRSNRGYGIFVNSSQMLTHIDGCTINENGGDGVRYVHGEERPDERIDRYGFDDFCNLAIVSSQTFPLQLFAEQTIFHNQIKSCDKVFSTRYSNLITLSVIRAVTNVNNSASFEVYDGSTLNHRLLTSFPIRNNTRPQSITSTGRHLFVKFRAAASTETVVFMRVFSSHSKSYDLNVSNSDVSENMGRGIAVDNLRSQVHVYKSSVSKNQHVAGLHVTSGVGDVNVTESRISFNEGDGINITYTGGSRNISRSSISSNSRYGLAVWLNDTKETEFITVNQTTVVQYSEIYKNLDTGILHGNFCGESLFNFTGNHFRNCANDALEVLTCWKNSNTSTRLQIGHNEFIGNNRIGLRITPALNLEAKIEYNHFRQGLFGALLIKNKPLEEFNILKTNIEVFQNYFINNTGFFVANLALSPYSENQNLLFIRNFVKNNRISEPFQPEDGSVSSLNPRSRVAAPIVVGSDNIDIFRNIIENPHSKYEIGSHLEDQSKSLNCTFNWLGFGHDEEILPRLFHRLDRYNLAKIEFTPFLLHNTNPLTNRINQYQYYIPKFVTPNSVGGEVEGEETLTPGEYVVEKDINIRPGGKLTIEPGVTLRFPPSVGMMVGGKLEARGIRPDSIKFTLKEEISHSPDNETYEIETEKYEVETEVVQVEPRVPIRLLGGATETEGRLQIKIDNEWGTVCNYGWTMKNAALVCQQLGYVLNPEDWFLKPSETPSAGMSEDVILSNVQCDDFDLDITKCKAETKGNFENSCTHENDVGIRCYKSSWAGVRFGALAERSNIQYITIEMAGLLDYATRTFKPALQIDFARQNFENIRVSNNFYHGMGVLYTDIYTDDTINIIKNSEFLNNKGAGISFKQLGFNIFGSLIENNYFGIKHNPVLTGLQQREFAGWFLTSDDNVRYKPLMIPEMLDVNTIQVDRGETKYLVTSKVIGESISRVYRFRSDPGWVIGIQLLNPIENRSTESVVIQDALSYNKNAIYWVLKRDLTVFPTTSSSYGIILEYNSRSYAIGGTVLVISTIRAPVQNIRNRIIKGPIPTLRLTNSKIRSNQFGIHASYYNRYLNELGDHFLRKANESFQLVNCEISHNQNEAIFVHSPHWDLHKSNISEVIIMINNSLITDNGKGFYHFSRDMRSSNNIFHYILQDDTIERNRAGGFDINLPYVWQYNENFTHSVYMDNNTWMHNRNFKFNIDGHFAVVNITRNVFSDNNCASGLITIGGMEKKLLISRNKFNTNNGKFIVEFVSNSQSEIIGEVPARFTFNELRHNKFAFSGRSFGILQLKKDPTSVVAFKGIQKVKIFRNLFSENHLDYQLIAGIKTAKIDNYVDVRENWWGTNDELAIKEKIFDFDDWNNYAIAKFKPYLVNDDFGSSYSAGYISDTSPNLNRLGGRITRDLILHNERNMPYIVQSDITVMPKATLTIDPGVVLEFAPNVGILVLGSLQARGYEGNEIIMRPISKTGHLESTDSPIVREKRQIENLIGGESIRLCKGRSCYEGEESTPREGFLEYFNKTTLQWIPMCDTRFTERNAQVVCRELGFDPLNVFFDHDIRVEFHSNSLSRIWTWPEPLQCKGTEKKYEDCPIRLNGQQFGHRHRCKWNSKFVFIHCGQRNLEPRYEYWGGIRFANPEFEQQLYAHRIHDVKTHSTMQSQESVMEYVNIIGAGILHNEKSPAIQSIIKSPKINFVRVQKSASHGINLISPSNTMNLLYNTVEDSLGVGINTLSLTGEGRESQESSFTPLKSLNIPYNLFSLVDMCDTHKEIEIQERILLYFKYDNHPVNCIKIFKSAYNIKPLGFRLLQFNLFNSTQKYGIPDFISLYDGDIFNVTSKLIERITMSSHNEKRLVRTKLPSLSIKLFANGASSNHGFIAEVVTLPISAIGFNRDVQHNISYSVVNNNREGAMLYMSAGEVNPIVTIDKNQFRYNCEKLYGNFTTCNAAVEIDIQNTQTIFFRNNLVEGNQGGLSIKADSRGSATSLKGYIHNNLFVNNSNLPVLYVEGRQSSPYQEVIIYRNYFTRNKAQYYNNIVLKQVVSNFTLNYMKRNIGLQNLEVSGFDKVRLPIYQTTSHNGFYHNYAIHRDSRSTIVAGTAGQHYVDNIFFNPDNDYEMITVNRSLTLQLWNTKIDAAYNYWGLNNSLGVRGRIKDQSDDPRLLEVIYEPYHMNNKSVLLNKKCPPGWDLVGGTCYIYIGAPMTFYEARAFCQADNATMPYLLGNLNYIDLYEFLRSQQQWFLYNDRVWVQHIDKINECTMFAYQRVEVDNCDQRNPFICEIDPKVSINILPLTDDVVTIAVLSSLALALLLMAIVGVFWWSKSKYRQTQRLERRNSIRQSLHSLRSVGLAPGSFSDASYRRKVAQLSSRSTDTLTKNPEYKKMITNGSLDSMEKSTYTSSLDDNQSYDVYEAHNPNPSAFAYSPTIEYHKSPNRFDAQYVRPNGFELAYKNEGFRDNSTFATNSNYQSRAESIQDSTNDDIPIIQDNAGGNSVSYPPSEYYTNDTLPLSHTSGKSDSTLDLKKGIDDYNKNRSYDPIYSRERPNANLLNELKSKFPHTPPPPPDPVPTEVQSPTYSEKLDSLQYSPDYNTVGLAGPPDDRPYSANILETDFDEPHPRPKVRAKSEVLLETNFDYTPPSGSPQLNHPITEYNRSKSQPLETAM